MKKIKLIVMLVMMMTLPTIANNDGGKKEIVEYNEEEKTIEIICKGDCDVTISVNQGIPFNNNIVVFRGEFSDNLLEIIIDKPGTYLIKIKEINGKTKYKTIII